MILRKNNGFTLIEVIISIAIIALIGVLLSGFISTTIKARNISHERLQTMDLCTSYVNDMKSVQSTYTSVANVKSWLIGKGFTDQTSYFEKTNANINLKVYINVNLNIADLYEIKIIGKPLNANELSISTVIKGGN